uniref:Uncharacterized protein n=1 Tax=viral metagenome TaxID=1070528 RepID=A0A6M3J810_9ZZZZ
MSEAYESRFYAEVDADKLTEAVCAEVRTKSLASARQSTHATPRVIVVLSSLDGAEAKKLQAAGRVRTWREQYDRVHSVKQWVTELEPEPIKVIAGSIRTDP